MKSWQSVMSKADIQASREILPSHGVKGNLLQQAREVGSGCNVSMMNSLRLSICSNLASHTTGDGGSSSYRPPPRPRNTDQDQLLAQSFGDPTNGGPWNPPRTKAGSSKEAAEAWDGDGNGSDGDGGGSK